MAKQSVYSEPAAAARKGRPTHRTAQEVARLGMLLALATALHTFEAQLPALPIPGAKVGLANVVSLLALYAFGLREALLIVSLRQIAGSLFLGTFLSPAFFFGLAGGLLSVFVMQLVRWVVPKASPVMLSLAGAAAHNTGQLLVAWWLTDQPAVLFYLPYLLWFAVPAGAFIGRLMESLMPYLRSAHMWQEDEAGQSRRRQRTWEIAAAMVLVILGGAVLFAGSLRPDAAAFDLPEAVIRMDGEIIMRLPLENNSTKRIITRDGGEMLIVVEDGHVHVAESTCNNQVCVRQGRIRTAKQSIVCVPYRTVITIEGAVAGGWGDVDAVTN